MSTALVLGGGGIVGLAWQLGIFDGLRSQGTEPGARELILGTSTGAVAGALLPHPQPVDHTQVLEQLESLALAMSDGPGASDSTALLDAMLTTPKDLGRWRPTRRPSRPSDT
ncbi:patatin-like phospholipase family protein [Nocardia sp. NEAU-G5]|uniref:Patatin-like phospholipase family protein n=1 Tax=Nocardia albiluteola TaxID=2842303 RepID=A0ABS6B3C4_9NOCA|nr:patatin-like phospholipase family protein [Nocardia albiluteola]MBU3064803.1 patatin-like phospholipase family protein [Nocardia albiluteola]